jgi:hypothetical protein
MPETLLMIGDEPVVVMDLSVSALSSIDQASFRRAQLCPMSA